MRSFRKSTLLILGAALGISAVFAQTKDGKTEDPKDPKAVAKEARAQNKKAAENAKDEFDLPGIPIGQPQKAVNVPFYGRKGNLEINWNAGIMSRVDDQNVKLTKSRVQIYKEDGKTVDLDLELPDSIYNRPTKNITSQVAVKILRGDVELTGQNMQFNLATHEGQLGGGVKTVINDRGTLFGGTKAPGESEAKTSVEFHKPPAEPVAPPKKENK